MSIGIAEFFAGLVRHPIATVRSSIAGYTGATREQILSSARMTAGTLLSGPNVPGPLGISMPAGLSAFGTAASLGTLGIVGAAATPLAAARIGKSGIAGGFGALRRHPLGAALSSTTGIGLLKKGTTFAVRAAKRSRKAAAKAKIAADKAKLREQVRAAKAEAKAAKASASSRRRSSGKKRRAGARAPRKMTAKQLMYFGKRKTRRAAA